MVWAAEEFAAVQLGDKRLNSRLSALILYRVMRQRLKLAGQQASPETALAHLRRIQRQTVTVDDSTPISGVSSVNHEQAGLLDALKLKTPSPDTLQALAQLPITRVLIAHRPDTIATPAVIGRPPPAWASRREPADTLPGNAVAPFSALPSLSPFL